jgi:hypothetical protein
MKKFLTEESLIPRYSHKRKAVVAPTLSTNSFVSTCILVPSVITPAVTIKTTTTAAPATSAESNNSNKMSKQNNKKQMQLDYGQVVSPRQLIV